MKILRNFIFMLTSALFIGLVSFQIIVGANLATDFKLKTERLSSKITDNSFFSYLSGPNVPYGYVNTNRVKIDSTEQTQKAAKKVLDTITEEVAGMTFEDMTGFMENLPNQ